MVSSWGPVLGNEYVFFALIVIIGFGLARAFLFFLETVVKALAQRTKTDLDDIILQIVTMPLYVFVLLITTHYAIKSLSVMQGRLVALDRIYFVFYIIGAAFLVSKILAVLISRWLKTHKKFEKTPQLVNKLVAVVVYIIAIILILNYYKIEVTPLIAGLGIGGVAIGLALQATLANFFAGISLISDKPIDAGQFIQLEGISGAEGPIQGYVEDISWRSTRIRTLSNTIVIIPNSTLSASTITNYALPSSDMALNIKCGVAYDSDLKKVEKAALETARKIQETCPGAFRHFEPSFSYTQFGDSNINFTVILRVNSFAEKAKVSNDFIKALKERFDKESIEISWPVRKVYSGDNGRKVKKKK